MAARKAARKPALERRAAPRKASPALSPEERAALRDLARERKATAEGANNATAVLERIRAMPQPDRGLAERIHAILTRAAPDLAPRLWYGMPAYAKNGQVVCFFQDAKKFKSRYATLGFTDKARLDDGALWPTSYALTELTPAAESTIAALVKRALE